MSDDRAMFSDFDDLPLVDPPSAAGNNEAARAVAAAPLAFNPPMPGVSSAFFTELDAVTQYADVYDVVPDDRYMQMFGKVTPVVAAWNRLATATTPDAQQAALAALRDALAVADVETALRGLDELMVGLLLKHCPDAAQGADADRYLDVVEAFARDVLAPDEDRVARVTAKDPDDGRIPNALRHRMDGAGMWFTWAAVVDASAILAENAGTSGGIEQTARAILLAGCAAGSAFDYTFRAAPGDPRGRTRPHYRPDQPTLDELRDAARAWALDLGEARSNARDLARIARDVA